MSIVSRPATQAFRDNFDDTFGKKPEPDPNEAWVENPDGMPTQEQWRAATAPTAAEVEETLRDARERTKPLRDAAIAGEDIGALPDMILRDSEPAK